MSGKTQHTPVNAQK